MIKRKRISKTKRARILDAAGDRCCLCRFAIDGGSPWIVEHVMPLWLGGEDDETNMVPAHVTCAAMKTKREAGARAKIERIINGGRKRRGRPMPGTIASGMRRRMDGTVERR